MKQPSSQPTKSLDDDDLRQLLLRAHVHDDYCYGRYEPCGEHHAHDNTCGARSLICRRREDPDAALYFAVITELLSRRAHDPTTKERDVLRTVRDVVSDSDILQWDNLDERTQAVSMLDKLIGGAA